MKIHRPSLRITLAVGAILLLLGTTAYMFAQTSGELTTMTPRAVLESSGCSIDKNLVRLRIDMYLDAKDPYFSKTHVSVVDETSPEFLAGYKGKRDKDGRPLDAVDYNNWWDTLPHKWQDVPFHTHFIYVFPTASDAEIKKQIEDSLTYFYKFYEACWQADKNFLDEWKRIPAIPGTAREEVAIGPSKDLQLSISKLADIKSRTNDFETNVTVTADFVLPTGKQTIDVGSGATDRANRQDPLITYVAQENPANGTGNIDTFQIWPNTNMTGCEAALFYVVSGNFLTTRSNTDIGNVSAGSAQTFTGLTLAVSTGDYLGTYFATGTLESLSTAGTGVWPEGGDKIPCTNLDFGSPLDFTLSIYGTGATVTDQTAYLFRNDNGTEITATSIAAENTAITAPADVNTRLRAQVATGYDLASQGYQLEYKNNSGPWTKAVATTPAISFGVATGSGTTAVTGKAGNGDLTVALPAGWIEGQCAIMVVYSDAGSGSVPTGWNEITGSPFGSATPKLQIFWRILITGDTNPITTISGSSGTLSSVGAIATYNSVHLTTPVEVIGTASVGTGTPMTAAQITTLTDGAWVLGICGRGDNDLSATETFGADATGVTERFDTGTSTGDDSEVVLYDKTIASKGLTGAGSAATSATDPWISVLISLKPRVNGITLSLSDNIAASAATATTAQLSVPGGKSFTAGAISDDTNPITTDIGNGYYSEWEWCVKANSAVIATSDVLTFRVTVAGVVLSTYTVTPSWTIGAGGPTPTPTPTPTPGIKSYGFIF
jgi:hypothetical protein